MSTGCRQENCTVGETGTCLLNNDPATCPNRITGGADDIDVAAEIAAPLKEPVQNPRFPLSLTLSPAQASELMGRRSCRLIGILGAPDAGKTAALVSLYLLVSADKLAGRQFADSRSLMAFDQISHGARRWNEGELPDQLTVHTELADDRSAGFLHLRLRSQDGDTVDILLPDLPGEWTAAMIDNNRTDRLEFLKAADVIWLMVDGRQLSAANTRQLALHRTKLLMQRLVQLLASPPPVILVITRHDTVAIDQDTLAELTTEASAHGLSLQVSEIASFADPAGPIAPGAGIRELLEASIAHPQAELQFWPDHAGTAGETRAMMRFGLGSRT